MDLKINGKVAFIGGSSRGLGYGCAQQLAKEGVNLVLCARGDSDLKKAKEKIEKESLEKIIKNLIDKYKTNFKGVGQPIRVALTGSKFGPGVYDIILSLDKDVVTKRLKMIN